MLPAAFALPCLFNHRRFCEALRRRPMSAYLASIAFSRISHSPLVMDGNGRVVGDGTNMHFPAVHPFETRNSISWRASLAALDYIYFYVCPFLSLSLALFLRFSVPHCFHLRLISDFRYLATGKLYQECNRER